MDSHSPDRPDRRSINLGSTPSYVEAVEALAAALGATNTGVLRAGLELAARRVIELSPGTPQAETAEAFLQESRHVWQRRIWADALQLDRPEGQSLGMADLMARAAKSRAELAQISADMKQRQQELLDAVAAYSQSQQLEAV